MSSGRSFLQVPGPTNVPDRVIRAMSRPLIDHRSPAFSSLTLEVLSRLKEVFGTRSGTVLIYPSSGTGALEASLVNVLGPGDRVLVYTNGHFCDAAAVAARSLGFEVDTVEVEWGRPVPATDVESRLRTDMARAEHYRALIVVHNETSTGVLSDIASIRRAVDAAEHDALLIVDVVSSLGSTTICVDDWGIDVAFAGSQKGLMLPPGLGIVAASTRAIALAESSGSPRHFFDWRPMIRDNASGFFPYTPATSLLFGLQEALNVLLDEEGLDAVYARHERLAAGVREAVKAWGLELVCKDATHASRTLTTFMVPRDMDSHDLISHARDRYGLSLGVGLGQLRGRAVRIGHLGALNELEVVATIAGVEMSMVDLGAGLPLGSGPEACLKLWAGPVSSLH